MIAILRSYIQTILDLILYNNYYVDIRQYRTKEQYCGYRIYIIGICMYIYLVLN